MKHLIWFIFILIISVIIGSIVIILIKNKNKNTCDKNCSNKGKCVNGVCKCDKNYRGNYCSIKCPSWCVSPYGTCDFNGNCVCSPGYGGDNCRSFCKNKCNLNGTCQPNKTCKCFDGYFGEDCSIKCPACNKNGGKCVLKNGKTVCECNPGYANTDCSIKCKNLCNAPNGNCTVDKGNGKCVCNINWLGDDCSILTFPKDKTSQYDITFVPNLSKYNGTYTFKYLPNDSPVLEYNVKGPKYSGIFTNFEGLKTFDLKLDNNNVLAWSDQGQFFNTHFPIDFPIDLYSNAIEPKTKICSITPHDK